MISQKKYPNGFWQNWNNIILYCKLIIEKNNGVFPTKTTMIKDGYSGMLDAINRHWKWNSVLSHFDLQTKKKCHYCKNVKNNAGFYQYEYKGKSKMCFVCLECHKLYQSEWKYRTPKNFLKQLVSLAKGRAKRKELEFDINSEFLFELFQKNNGRCALTNIPLVINKPTGSKKIKHEHSPSIDRIDPNKGYTKENIRLVCWAINSALNYYGEQKFYELAKAFIEIYNLHDAKT